MTIIELIEKLREENFIQTEQGKEPNGSYGVLDLWFEKIINLDPKSDSLHFEYYYNSIYGMIYGLRAAYFITEEEKDQLVDDLNRIMESFYGIGESKP